jgi:hypothetical protein
MQWQCIVMPSVSNMLFMLNVLASIAILSIECRYDELKWLNVKTEIYPSPAKKLGPGKSTYPLSAKANVLSATLCFLQKYVCPYYDISVLPAGGE